MLDIFDAENNTDTNKHPTGGFVSGTGLNIDWQDGPLGRGKDRKEPNGAFVETVIAAAKQRIEFYQESEFACRQNAQAIIALQDALDLLNNRTKEREERQVEGEHIV